MCNGVQQLVLTWSEIDGHNLGILSVNSVCTPRRQNICSQTYVDNFVSCKVTVFIIVASLQ
jgi:hypothetical protein